MSSRKRSSTRPPPSRADRWVLFFDRDLGKAIPNAVRDAGYRIQTHDDNFPADTRDEDWLPEVARRGWIALSHNKRIRRTTFQRDVAMRSNLALFMLIGDNHADLRTNLLQTLPAIIRFRERYEPPFIAHVTRPSPRFPIGSRPGNVQIVLTAEQWRERLAVEGRRT